VAGKRHSKEEIDAKLRLADRLTASGKLQKDVAAALGVSLMTFHRWRKARRRKGPHGLARNARERVQEPAGLAKIIEELERENARLRGLVTDLLLVKSELEEALRLPQRRATPVPTGRRPSKRASSA
jgi:putative transposase